MEAKTRKVARCRKIRPGMRGNKIHISISVISYDDATQREVSVTLVDNGAWRWQTRRRQTVEASDAGRLAPGVLQAFLKQLRRALAASGTVRTATRGFWFVRLYAAGSLLQFFTGPVAGNESALARLDELLVRELHLAGGVFTAP